MAVDYKTLNYKDSNKDKNQVSGQFFYVGKFPCHVRLRRQLEQVFSEYFSVQTIIEDHSDHPVSVNFGPAKYQIFFLDFHDFRVVGKFEAAFDLFQSESWIRIFYLTF